MQVETKDTITKTMLDSEKDPLEFACRPLGKLEFVADTISALCDYGSDDVFQYFDTFSILSMGDIIKDATHELLAIINAAVARIDALEAQVKSYEQG